MGVSSEDILGIFDLKTKDIEVDEWKKTLTIRELSLDDGMKMLSMIKGQDKAKATLTAHDIAQVIAWGVVDSNGERVFCDADVPRLAAKNRRPLMFIYSQITSLSGGDAEKN